MEFIGSVFFFVGLLMLLYGLIGLINPSWVKAANLSGTPSRMDCALFASLAPLPFMFVGDLVHGLHEPADMFAFVMGLILVIGSLSFYLWGVVSVNHYLTRDKKFDVVIGVLVGCMLAVVPVFGFILLILGMGVSSSPEFSWIQQLVMFISGFFIIIGFMSLFKAPLLGRYLSSVPVAAPVVERHTAVVHTEAPAVTPSASSNPSSWLFSFTYAEDDGLPIRVDAHISAAEADHQGRRYIQGVCTKTSTPRFFWLGRILGPMTGPVVEGSGGEQWDAGVVFERLQALRQPQTDPLGAR